MGDDRRQWFQPSRFLATWCDARQSTSACEKALTLRDCGGYYGGARLIGVDQPPQATLVEVTT
jgi:hypothetical protein